MCNLWNNVRKVALMLTIFRSSGFIPKFSIASIIPHLKAQTVILSNLCDQSKLHFKNLKHQSRSLQVVYDIHLVEANERWNMNGDDKKKYSQNLLKEKVITIDFQKCLPTTDLENSLKLWTYNLTILNATLE